MSAMRKINTPFKIVPISTKIIGISIGSIKIVPLVLPLTKPIMVLYNEWNPNGDKLRKSSINPEFLNVSIDDCQKLSEKEKNLVKNIVLLKNLLLTIDTSNQTHLLAYYTYELANLFHTYYNSSKAIVDDVQQTKSNLFIIKIMHQTFELCFDLMGISSPKKM